MPCEPSLEPRILIVDDEEDIREMCSEALAEAGFPVLTAASGSAALEALAAGSIDIVLSDIRMPGCDGLTLLRQIREAMAGVDVILMTGHASVATAVEALRLGAYDYVTKPFSIEDLLHRVFRLVERRALSIENRVLRGRVAGGRGPAGIVGDSPPMRKLYQLLARVADRRQPVLITGESGTGKELAARALHELGSNPAGPYIAIDCGALSASLVESELFGHRQGAFTGATQNRPGLMAAAGRGTLFLDEIGELPLDLQAKLLRVLQEREIRPVGATQSVRLEARVVAATNRDLGEAVRLGHFRSDLYYRLNVLAIAMPPLRERPGDIALLVQHLIEREAEATRDHRIRGISAAALSLLDRCPWPGNVRELANHIHRAMALSAGPLLVPNDFAPELAPAFLVPGSGVTWEDAERDAILRALSSTGGNRVAAARLLNMGKTTIYKKLKEYGIANLAEAIRHESDAAVEPMPRRSPNAPTLPLRSADPRFR